MDIVWNALIRGGGFIPQCRDSRLYRHGYAVISLPIGCCGDASSKFSDLRQFDDRITFDGSRRPRISQLLSFQKATASSNLTRAILTMDISKGTLLNVTFTGGLDRAWLAAILKYIRINVQSKHQTRLIFFKPSTIHTQEKNPRLDGWKTWRADQKRRLDQALQEMENGADVDEAEGGDLDPGTTFRISWGYLNPFASIKKDSESYNTWRDTQSYPKTSARASALRDCRPERAGQSCQSCRPKNMAAGGVLAMFSFSILHHLRTRTKTSDSRWTYFAQIRSTRRSKAACSQEQSRMWQGFSIAIAKISKEK